MNDSHQQHLFCIPLHLPHPLIWFIHHILWLLDKQIDLKLNVFMLITLVKHVRTLGNQNSYVCSQSICQTAIIYDGWTILMGWWEEKYTKQALLTVIIPQIVLFYFLKGGDGRKCLKMILYLGLEVQQCMLNNDKNCPLCCYSSTRKTIAVLLVVVQNA